MNMTYLRRRYARVLLAVCDGAPSCCTVHAYSAGILCPVSTIPLPFCRCRFAVPDSRCRFRTPLPLPLPLRIFLPFAAVTERNFFLRNFYRTTEFYNGRTGETGTEERQRNGGNRAADRHRARADSNMQCSSWLDDEDVILAHSRYADGISDSALKS